jgi:hypothetical protein
VKTITTRLARFALALSLTALVAGAAVAPVLAADTVTQVVTAGSRTASVANLTLAALNYSHSAQTSTGSMTLTADDSTGSGAGWNVTILSSALAYTGTNSGTAIPAANFSITTANAPSMTAGEAVDATNGPKVPATGATGTLDAARKTVQANAGYGEGTYTQALAVSLSVPAQSRAGTYTATLTTTISAAP